MKTIKMAFLLICTVACFSASGALVCHLPMDEGQGTMVNDHSGNGNNGEISGGIWSEGLLFFDGKTANLKIPHAPSLEISDEITIETWINLQPIFGYKTIFSNGKNSLSLYYAPHRPRFTLQIDKKSITVSATEELSYNKWYHLSVTYDGKKLILFINGRSAGEIDAEGKISFNKDPYSLGGFSGFMKGFRIHNKALGAAEIEKDFKDNLKITEIKPIMPEKDTQNPMTFEITLDAELDAAAGSEVFDSVVSRTDFRENLFLSFKNSGNSPLRIKSIFINGKNIEDLVKEGIKSGGRGRKDDVVRWYDIVPSVLSPGEWGEIKIRLGSIYETGKKLKIILKSNDKVVSEKELEITKREPVIFHSYSFDENLKNLYLYLKAETATGIKRILVNGKDMTSKSTIRPVEAEGSNFFICLIPFEGEEGQYKIVRIESDHGDNFSSLRVMKPFFPIGMLTVTDRRDKDKTKEKPAPEEWFQDIKEHNINTVYYAGLYSSTERYKNKTPFPSEYLKKYGLRFVDDTWHQTELIEKYRNSPQILAWSIADEPAKMQPTAIIKIMNEEYKKYDLRNPVSLVHYPDGYAYYEHNYVDIISVDAYLVGNGDIADCWGGKCVGSCYNAARPKPVWFVAHAYNGSHRGGRHPTPEEERLMIYAVLGHGAKGIFYWCYSYYYGCGYGVGKNVEEMEALYDLEKDKLQRDLAGVKDDAKKLWESMRFLNQELSMIGMQVAQGAVIPVTTSNCENVKIHSIFSGDTTIVLIAVNYNYEYNYKSFTAQPKKNITATINIPPWFKAKKLMEITDGKEIEKKYSAKDKFLQFDIDELNIARVFVIKAE